MAPFFMPPLLVDGARQVKPSPRVVTASFHGLCGGNDA
jgi:hypothetical protein